MATLQDLQFPIDQAIAAELLRCLPRTWVRATLIASRAAVQIEGSGQAGEATASHELETRVRELFVLNEQFKTDLAGIEYTYTCDADGRWSFVGDYKYPD